MSSGVRKVAGVANLLRRAGLLAWVIIVLSVAKGVYAQADTTLNFELCGSEGPQLNITSPESDSITPNPDITISGNALRTTQIDVTVNGVYDQSVAINPGSSSFAIPLTLYKGTDTITLKAFYSCNQTTSAVSLVITYIPSSVTSTGKLTNTASPAQSHTTPETITNPSNNVAQTNSLPLGTRLKHNLGFGAVDNSLVRPIASWAALILAVAAVFEALAPRTLAHKLRRFMGVALVWQLSNVARFFVRLLLLLIAIGLALFVQS